MKFFLIPQTLHFACSTWQLKYVARNHCWAGKPLHNRRFARLMAFVCIGNQFVIERWPWRAGGRIGDARSCVSMPWLFRVFYYGACLHHRGLLAGKSERIVILSLRVFEIAALSLKEKYRWQKWPKPQCCPPRRWACANVMTLEWILIGKWWGKQCRNRKEDEDEEKEHL